MRRLARLAASLTVILLTSPAPAFDIVYDPTAVAKLVDQVQQMEKQLTALNDQLTQAKRLYDSFNKLTNAGDVAGLLNSTQFRKYLPAEFSQIESLVNGSGSGSFASSLDSYLTQNRVYTANPGNASTRPSSTASRARPGRATRSGRPSTTQRPSASTGSTSCVSRSGRRATSRTSSISPPASRSSRRCSRTMFCACRALPWSSGRRAR